MGDSRNYAALDWVLGEISDTLKEARQSLEDYVEDPKDETKIRFCLTHIHQVHGSLQIVEFHGATLLAEEMELLAQAIMNQKVINLAEAEEVLMRSMLQLPVFLEHIKSQKEDNPSTILPLLNDIRAARKERYLSETNLFTPDLSSVGQAIGKKHALLGDAEKLTQVMKKLREMYQFAAASVLRGIKIDENLAYVEKVFSRLEAMSRGTKCYPLWQVGAVLVEELRSDEIELSVAVRGLLRHFARELRVLGEKGSAAFNLAPRESLLKNLLYYLAKSESDNPRLAEVKKQFALDAALLGKSREEVTEEDLDQKEFNHDPEAIRSVIIALQDEMTSIKSVLDLALGGQGATKDIKELLPAVKRVADTLAVLGIGNLRKQMLDQVDELEVISEAQFIDEPRLMAAASQIIEVEQKLEAVSKVADTSQDLSKIDEREVEIDDAKKAVIGQCRVGLDQAKESIVEYISSQWDKSHLQDVGQLLTDIRGGLEMIPLYRPASIVDACSQYISDQLLGSDQHPTWETLDTLADAIASVEYYLEHLAGDLRGDSEALLNIAEESVLNLGYQIANPEQSGDVSAEEHEAPLGSSEESEQQSQPQSQQQEHSDHHEEDFEPEYAFSSDAEAAYPQVTEETDVSYEQAEVTEPVNEERYASDTVSFEQVEDEEAESLPEDLAGVHVESTSDIPFTDVEQPDFVETSEPVQEDESAEPVFTAAEIEPEAQVSEFIEQSPVPESAPPLLNEVEEEVEEDQDADDVDEEIKEIFIEEAGEVLETLREYYPRWKENHANEESLTTVRRAFHTLKGSGRMVGAVVIGELAWSIENMLNRVIDKTISVSDELFFTVDTVIDFVPGLVKDFEERYQRRKAKAAERYGSWAYGLVDEKIEDSLREAMGGGTAVEEPIAETSEPPVSEAPVETVAPATTSEYQLDSGTLVIDDSALPSAAEDADDEDQMLREIFSSEAQFHLSIISDFIGEMDNAAPIYSPPSNDLQRALHTLKGSAKMAQIDPIGDITEPLESFAKELVAYQVTINDDILQLFKDLVKYTEGGLEQINSGQPVSIEKSEQFIARTDELRELAVGHLARLKEQNQLSEDNEVNPELLSIFMAEEMRLLLDADEIHRAWQANPSEDQQIHELAKELNTLAVGADHANLPGLKQLSELLEALHKAALEGDVTLDSDFFGLLDRAHGTLLDMVDAVAAGQHIQPLDQGLVDEIESKLIPSPINEPVEVTDLAFVVEELATPLAAENDQSIEVANDAQADDAFESDAFGGSLEEFVAPSEQDPEIVVDDVDSPVEFTADEVVPGGITPDVNPFDQQQPPLEGDSGDGTEEITAIDDHFDVSADSDDAVSFEELETEDGLESFVADDEMVSSSDDETGENSRSNDGLLEVEEVTNLDALAEDDALNTADVIEIQFDEPAEETEDTSLVVDFADPDASGETAENQDSEQIIDMSEYLVANHENDDITEASSDEIITEEAITEEAITEEVISQEIGAEEETTDDGLEAGFEESPEAPVTPFELIDDEVEEETSVPVVDDEDMSIVEEDAEIVLDPPELVEDTQVELNQDDFHVEPIEPVVAEEEQSFVEKAVEQPVEQVAETPSSDQLEGDEAQVIPGLIDSIDINDENFDQDILEVFIEEADELVEELDESISEWEADWGNTQSVEALKRSLHTFKGGARLAGLINLGELAHEFESYLIVTRVADIDEEFFANVHGFQDKLLSATRGVKQFVDSGATAAIAEEQDEERTLPKYDVEIPDDYDTEHFVVEEVQEPVQADEPQSQNDNVIAFSPKPPSVSADQAEFSMPTVSPSGGQAAAAAPAPKKAGPQEVVRVGADLLEELVNLAGETSINRSRLENHVSDFGHSLDEMNVTIERLQEQLRRLDIETEAQVLFRQEQMAAHDEFDPLEMDRYSALQQLSRSLSESSSDLVDLKQDLVDKLRDTETLLVQQQRINTNLQEGLMRSRMVPFSRMVPRLRRIVRQVAGELGKHVSFELDNVEGELDRSVLERMVPPFEHMLRNAVDHGIELPEERMAEGKPESGRIVLTLGREGGDVIIRLADDGRGVNLERVKQKAIERGLMTADTPLSDHDITQFILHAGFSTAESVTQISGRGVGMDVVHSEIKQLGGAMTINSKWGQGTEFVIRLPFTLSVNRALMVQIGHDNYAVPLSSIEGIVRVSPFELEHYYDNPEARFEYANENYHVRYLGGLLDNSMRPKLEGHVLPLPVLLVRSAEHTMALHVDSLLGSREIVVKSLGPQFAAVNGLSGATVMGDGSVVVILDPHALVRQEIARATLPPAEEQELIEQAADDRTVKTVMVVDDSVTVRKVTSRFLEREGFEVITAKDGVDALRVLQEQMPDVMLLDIEMPRMDGFEVAKNIRTTRRWQHLPIIMITSRTGDKHREHALSLGVNKYLGKPYQEDVLLGNINELIEEARSGK